jgi:tetrapyrrole methylase family protein/MazG family protein
MVKNEQSPAADLQELLDIIARLRAPEGCLWDRRQKKSDVGKYLMEEAFEVLDAIEREAPGDVKEELGDLLFQILFIARIAEEEGEFDIRGVIQDITAKMIRRHPHVFGDEKVENVEDIRANWETIKQRVEMKSDREGSLLQNIPLALPALLRAEKVTKEAAKAGFDWENVDGVIEKIEEELNELRQALSSENRERIRDEMGDILLSFVNLGRFAGVDSEEALRYSTQKFMKRFKYMENRFREQGRSLSGASLDEMDVFWNEAKKIE